MSSGGDEPAAEALWASARSRYEKASEAVSAIARDLGITAQALTAKARALGWTLRSTAKPKAAGTRETIARLKSLLQQRLSDLESQIGELGEAVSAVSSERDIRAMNTLVRTLDKVLELERKDRSQRSKQRKQHRAFDDAEREALAQRLEGLHRELQGERESELGSADPGGAGTEP